MSSKNPTPDFQAANEYGITLVRFGATGTPADFTYLVSGNGETESWDLSTANHKKLLGLLDKVSQHGLKAVFSLADIPGRRWAYRNKDCRIWKEARFQNEFIQAWKTIAQVIKGHSGLVGYDLMNEPYLPNPRTCSGITSTALDLNSLYRKTIAAIREVDSLTPIILESAGMASPYTMDALPILDDERILYSFHYYEPFAYFSAPENQGKLMYPGWIPGDDGIPVYWDKSQHKKALEAIVSWQKLNNIQSYRIYVGEFGVWRKAKGAEQYLLDLTDLFSQAGWSWSYYSFREDDWDNTDLEKIGMNRERRKTSLFKSIQKKFQ